jgi:hypothetical protein
LPIAGEVVLDDERAVKAECLGLDVVFDEITESFAAVEFRTTAPRRRTAEQAESHRGDLRPAVSSRAGLRFEVVSSCAWGVQAWSRA